MMGKRWINFLHSLLTEENKRYLIHNLLYSENSDFVNVPSSSVTVPVPLPTPFRPPTVPNRPQPSSTVLNRPQPSPTVFYRFKANVLNLH